MEMIVNLLQMLGTHDPHPTCHRTHETTVLLFYGFDEEGERLLHIGDVEEGREGMICPAVGQQEGEGQTDGFL